MKQKKNLGRIAQQIRNYSEQPSPILFLHFESALILGNKLLINCIFSKGIGNFSRFDVLVNTPRVVTPFRVEQWLLRKITRSIYKTPVLEDKSYTVDTREFSSAFAKHLFDIILKNKGTKSWLPFFQESILNGKNKKEPLEDGDYLEAEDEKPHFQINLDDVFKAAKAPINYKAFMDLEPIIGVAPV